VRSFATQNNSSNPPKFRSKQRNHKQRVSKFNKEERLRERWEIIQSSLPTNAEKISDLALASEREEIFPIITDARTGKKYSKLDLPDNITEFDIYDKPPSMRNDDFVDLTEKEREKIMHVEGLKRLVRNDRKLWRLQRMRMPKKSDLLTLISEVDSVGGDMNQLYRRYLGSKPTEEQLFSEMGDIHDEEQQNFKAKILGLIKDPAEFYQMKEELDEETSEIIEEYIKAKYPPEVLMDAKNAAEAVEADEEGRGLNSTQRSEQLIHITPTHSYH
jgi:hypothetical protein